MNAIDQLALDRLLHTLDIVAREGLHLAYSWGRLYAQPIDPAWVEGLDSDPELAERLEAFVSRFGRMQDTIADKLLPRWLIALAETPGSLIETLNRAERLGVPADVEQWLEARKLRNRLVHEYVVDHAEFAENLRLAGEYSMILFDTYNRLREFAASRMGVDHALLPEVLVSPAP